MAFFRPKPWVNLFGNMSIFGLYKLLVFIAQKAVFSFQNVVKDIFLAYIALKKKLEKWPFWDKNHWLTPLENCQFLGFLNFLFLQRKNVIFSFQNILKKILLPYIAIKKKVGKMTIFEPKPWVNPFGKLPIFGLFELLVFIPQKGIFSFQNIVKHIFLAYIALNKKLEKWPFLDQNHGLTPLKKCQFLEFLNFSFLYPRKAFFRSRGSQKTFTLPILP